MFPIVRLGPLSLQTPGLILLLGIGLGLWLAEKRARQNRAFFDLIYDLVFVALISAIIGARLGYALRYPLVFLSKPINLLLPTPLTLDLNAGLLFGGIASLIFIRRRHMDLWITLDLLTPALAFFAMAFHLSNLASGDAYGAPAQLPWSLHLWGASRHPTQIYALILAGFIFVWVMKSPQYLPAGITFWLFIGASALARLFIEPFRGDSLVLFSGLRIAQLISWAILALSLYQISQRLPKHTDTDIEVSHEAER